MVRKPVIIRNLVRLAAACCFAFQFAASAQTAAQTTAAQTGAPAGRVKLGDGRVSFVPPAGFRRLTEDEVARKYVRGDRPQHVFADEAMTTSVAVTFSEASVAPEQLAELRLETESMLARTIPGLRWLARDFVELAGRRWLHFELTSSAADTDIHNHVYTTSLDGRALSFAFNSTAAQYPKVKDALEKSARSIEFQDR